MTNLCDIFKRELFARWATDRPATGGPDSIAALLDRYFQPLLVEEHFRMYPRPLPREVTVSFRVGRTGEIDNINIIAPKKVETMFATELFHEMGAWRLPPVADPVAVTHTFAMP